MTLTEAQGSMLLIGLIGCIVLVMVFGNNGWFDSQLASKRQVRVAYGVTGLWASLWILPPITLVWIKGIMG